MKVFTPMHEIYSHSFRIQINNILFCIIIELYFVISIVQDYGDVTVQLVSDMEECSQALVNLLLTGAAVKHIHNGSIIYGNSGQLLVRNI